ncbi:MAG TPA: hypothetical protein VI387_12015, partial [Candidatus Brocadiales bacterium]|nr:hypothetical protein [Candidatus Brocadiales bacterium]
GLRILEDYNLNVRMPYLMLEDDEVKAIMAYLAGIAYKNPVSKGTMGYLPYQAREGIDSRRVR